MSLSKINTIPCYAFFVGASGKPTGKLLSEIGKGRGFSRNSLKLLFFVSCYLSWPGVCTIRLSYFHCVGVPRFTTICIQVGSHTCLKLPLLYVSVWFGSRCSSLGGGFRPIGFCFGPWVRRERHLPVATEARR